MLLCNQFIMAEDNSPRTTMHHLSVALLVYVYRDAAPSIVTQHEI